MRRTDPNALPQYPAWSCQTKIAEPMPGCQASRMTLHEPSPFRYFNSSPEVIRLAVMMYVKYPLSLRNVEDLLGERGIDISHETVRSWWNRFGPLFAEAANLFFSHTPWVDVGLVPLGSLVPVFAFKTNRCTLPRTTS